MSLREGWHRSARPLSSPSPRVASGQQQHSIGRSRSFFLLQHSSWFNTEKRRDRITVQDVFQDVLALCLAECKRRRSAMADPHTHMGKEQGRWHGNQSTCRPPVPPSPLFPPFPFPSPPLSCASASAAPSLLLRLSAHSTQQEESPRNTQTTQQAEQKQEENTQSSEPAAIPTYAVVSTRRLRAAAASAFLPVSLSLLPLFPLAATDTNTSSDVLLIIVDWC